MKPKPIAPHFLGVLCAVLTVSVARADAATQPKPFELKDGDVVAFIGNTFVEREQSYSYLETLLRTRWPDRKISFRNLGWSGDTVYGASRGYFENADAGFARLTKITHDLKPTVIFISYGMGESFDGEAGLPSFRSGLERMLDMLKDLNARETVLIGPIQHEKLGPPLPDPAEHNKWLRTYADAMKAVAAGRGHRFVDLFDVSKEDSNIKDGPYTENGIHLSQYGYWLMAGAVEELLGLPDRSWTVTLGPGDKHTISGDAIQSSRVEALTGGGYRLQVSSILPASQWPRTSNRRRFLPNSVHSLIVQNAAKPKWTLSINGKLAQESDAQQGGEVKLNAVSDSQVETVEKIRQLSIQKNVQYFNQWRPANETYIFGFRAYEQGKNAAEMPQFTKPIEEIEAEITKLTQPIETVYEIKPQ